MFFIETIQQLKLFPEIIVMIVAMMPIAEVRGALPLAIGIYKMSFVKAAFLSIIGNMIPVIIILLVFEKILETSKKRDWSIHGILDRFYQKIHRKHSRRYEVLGVLFLVSFVALPLPFTGAWTGSIAALVFDIPFKRAFLSILVGVIFATVIMFFITIGILSIT